MEVCLFGDEMVPILVNRFLFFPNHSRTTFFEIEMAEAARLVAVREWRFTN